MTRKAKSESSGLGSHWRCAERIDCRRGVEWRVLRLPRGLVACHRSTPEKSVDRRYSRRVITLARSRGRRLAQRGWRSGWASWSRLTAREACGRFVWRASSPSGGPR